MKAILSLILIIFIVSVGLWAFGDTPREAVKHSVNYIGVIIAVVVMIHIIAVLAWLLIYWLIESKLLRTYVILTVLTVLAFAISMFDRHYPAISHRSFFGVSVFWILNMMLVPWILLGFYKFIRERVGRG